jgi:hypothetical protein
MFIKILRTVAIIVIAEVAADATMRLLEKHWFKKESV